MWLTYVAVPLVILAVIASIAGGGIFTIILVPLAVICVLAALVAAAGARASRPKTTGGRVATHSGPGGSALPHRRSSSNGRAATTPAALADARREQQ